MPVFSVHPTSCLLPILFQHTVTCEVNGESDSDSCFALTGSSRLTRRKLFTLKQSLYLYWGKKKKESWPMVSRPNIYIILQVINSLFKVIIHSIIATTTTKVCYLPTLFSPTMTLQQPTFFLLILAQTPVQHPWHLYIHAAMISLVDPIFSVCYRFAWFSRNHMYAPSPFLTICFPGHISHTCMCSVWWNETHSWPVNCHCWNNVGMYFSFSLKRNDNNKNKQTNK